MGAWLEAGILGGGGAARLRDRLALGCYVLFTIVLSIHHDDLTTLNEFWHDLVPALVLAKRGRLTFDLLKVKVGLPQ